MQSKNKVVINEQQKFREETARAAGRKQMKKLIQISKLKQMKMRMKIKEVVERKIDGIGVIEVILIIVVLIALVIIFRKQITELVENILGTISDKAGEVTE